MPGRNEKKHPPALRHAGLGIELVGGVVGFALLGLWIDRHYESSPWGTLICVVLGLIGGLYNLVRSSLKAFSIKDEQGRFANDDDHEQK